MKESEIKKLCKEVDPFIADSLAESIIQGISYDMLEARHGVLPISRRSFYRKKRIAQKLMQNRGLETG